MKKLADLMGHANPHTLAYQSAWVQLVAKPYTEEALEKLGGQDERSGSGADQLREWHIETLEEIDIECRSSPPRPGW